MQNMHIEGMYLGMKPIPDTVMGLCPTTLPIHQSSLYCCRRDRQTLATAWFGNETTAVQWTWNQTGYLLEVDVVPLLKTGAVAGQGDVLSITMETHQRTAGKLDWTGLTIYGHGKHTY